MGMLRLAVRLGTWVPHRSYNTPATTYTRRPNNPRENSLTSRGVSRTGYYRCKSRTHCTGMFYRGFLGCDHKKNLTQNLWLQNSVQCTAKYSHTHFFSRLDSGFFSFKKKSHLKVITHEPIQPAIRWITTFQTLTWTYMKIRQIDRLCT